MEYDSRYFTQQHPTSQNNITNPISLRIINNNRSIPNKKDELEQSRQLPTKNENKNNTKYNINFTIPSIKSKHQNFNMQQYVRRIE